MVGHHNYLTIPGTLRAELNVAPAHKLSRADSDMQIRNGLTMLMQQAMLLG
jgi:hypothetical protein